MRRLVSRVFLILSIITFTLAVPTLVREIRQERLDVAGVPEDAIPVSDWEKRGDLLEKPWNKYSDEAWRRRDPSSASSSAPSESGGSTAADHELSLDFPPSSPQMGTSGVQHSSPSSPEVKRPSDEDYLSPGSSFPSGRNRESVASENYIGSNEGGPGSSKEGYSSSSSSVPEVVPPDPLNNPSNPLGGSSSTTSSKPKKNVLGKFVSKSKSSLSKLFGKLKLKPRRHTGTSDSHLHQQ